MCGEQFNLEDEIIEKVDLQEYIKKFDPEIQNILYSAYGKNMEAMPKEVSHPHMKMEMLLQQLLKLNNVKSQKIILMRFGIATGQAMTLEEVANEFGMTRERVRMIESRFLRRPCLHRKLIDYLND